MLLSLFRSILWSTVSKAVDKSKRTRHVTPWLFITFKMWYFMLIRVVSVLWYSQYADWFFSIRLCLSMCEMICIKVMYAYVCVRWSAWRWCVRWAYPQKPSFKLVLCGKIQIYLLHQQSQEGFLQFENTSFSNEQLISAVSKGEIFTTLSLRISVEMGSNFQLFDGDYLMNLMTSLWSTSVKLFISLSDLRLQVSVMCVVLWTRLHSLLMCWRIFSYVGNFINEEGVDFSSLDFSIRDC